jgi:DNA-binding NarL/FixJ family response regulator
MREADQLTPRPRVLIADDHGIVAEGIRALLEQTCVVIGIVKDGRQLITEAPRLNPDVVVLDIGMPLLNGLDAAERLKESLPSTKFVFLTMQDDANLAAAVLKLGAVGFVLKHAAASELLDAVSRVLQGKAYITPKLRAGTRVERETRARQFSKELTPRQLEVLQLLAEGRPMKEIADILKVSEKTVMFHKYNIMDVL